MLTVSISHAGPKFDYLRVLVFVYVCRADQCNKNPTSATTSFMTVCINVNNHTNPPVKALRSKRRETFLSILGSSYTIFDAKLFEDAATLLIAKQHNQGYVDEPSS